MLGEIFSGGVLLQVDDPPLSALARRARGFSKAGMLGGSFMLLCMLDDIIFVHRRSFGISISLSEALLALGIYPQLHLPFQGS